MTWLAVGISAASLAMQLGGKLSGNKGVEMGGKGVGLLGGLAGAAGSLGSTAATSGGAGAMGPLMENGAFFSGGGGGAMSGAGGMAGPLMESGSFTSGGGTPPGGGMLPKDPMGLTNQLMGLFGGGGSKPAPVAPQSGMADGNLTQMAQNYLYRPTATQASARESQEDPYARLRRIRSQYYG